MYFLFRKQTDPYFNLAAEEYLLREGPGDMFVLWRNQPCVVIGKHQNAFAEINYRYCRNHAIPVVRRISGGGAVYHDLGNINFSFVQTVGSGNQVDFQRFLLPMMDTFRKLGIEVTTGKRNDLFIDGMKFSGNAEHVYRNKVLHHGTLLFDANLDMLDQALTPSEKKFSDRAIKSVRSRVANLKPYIVGINSPGNLIEKLMETINPGSQQVINYDLSHADINRIEKLANEKYRTWKWNFGYSPEFSLAVGLVAAGRKCELAVKVRNGQIIEITPVTNHFPVSVIEKISRILIGKNFEEQEIRSACQDSGDFFIENDIDTEMLIDSLF